MERADVVHVWVDVGVRRVKGRLRPHRGVPLGRDPDEGDVGEGRTARQRRRPAENTDRKQKEKSINISNMQSPAQISAPERFIFIFLFNSGSLLDYRPL